MHLIPLVVYIVLIAKFPFWTLVGTGALIVILSVWDLCISQRISFGEFMRTLIGFGLMWAVAIMIPFVTVSDFVHGLLRKI